MAKRAFSITIDKDLYDKLKEIAAEQNRTLSNLIDTILNEWLDKRK